MKQWWYQPLTIADFTLPDAEEVLRINPAELAEAKSMLGFNTEHLGCSDVWGGEKGVFYFQTRIARQVPRDLLNEYLPEAHKRGIRVLVYYNVHWINPEFGRNHHGWLQVDSEGRIISDLYGSGNAPCVNSSWREWSLKGLEDMASYDIDGVFLDGPIFAPEACYCINCREKFEQKYGLNLPKWEDWNDPAWSRFIDFRYDSIAEYLRDAEKTLKKVRPNAIIYMNSTGLWPAWPAARDNRRLLPYQDILGAEGGFLYYDLRSESLWKPGMTAKLLEAQSGGKPTVVFIAGANKGWDEYLLTGVETKLLYADTIANGANPWYGIPLALKNKPGALAAGEMNGFILRNTEYLEDTVPLARVGLFWSARTADFYRASIPVTDFTPKAEKLGKRATAGNFYQGFLGCYEILARSHMLFKILDEGCLRLDVLHGYDLIIMPNCACIPRDKVEDIREYVKNGGNLIASFECSRYDEHGEMFEELGLAEVFGVKVGRGVFGPMMLDYMSIIGEHSVAEGLSTKLLPCPTYGLEVIPTSSETIALFHEKMSSRYVKLPSLSKNPAILMNNYGEGRCLYIAGNFFEHYGCYHNPDYRRIIANAVGLMSRSLVTLENCPQSVEITLRHQHSKRRLVMHLVNFTGEMTRPIESIMPIRDLRICLHGFKSIRHAKALRLNMELVLENTGGDVAFKLPILREHEVIVLEPYSTGS